MSIDVDRPWYIVRCRPSAELRAGEEILSLGLTVYCPQYRKEYKHARQNRWVSRYMPTMPGYLFVMATAHWSRVLGCESVERILRNKEAGDQGLPVPVPDSVVAGIRASQEAGDFDQLKVHGRMVKVGDEVKVAEGALNGLRGIVQRTGDNDLTILLSILGREVMTKVPVEILARTG